MINMLLRLRALYARTSYTQIFGALYCCVALYMLINPSAQTAQIIGEWGLSVRFYAFVLLICGLLIMSNRGPFAMLSLPFIVYCISLALHVLNGDVTGVKIMLIALWLLILKVAITEQT